MYNLLLLSAARPRTVGVSFDGHHSHISLELLKVARSNDIHLVCLPPHVTHLIQPLDVSVFGPVKMNGARFLKCTRLRHVLQLLQRKIFLVC